MATAREMAIELRDLVDWKIEEINKKLSAWVEEFSADPCRAMSWSSNPMKDTARLGVYRLVQYAFEAALDDEKPATPESAADYLVREGSNIMHRFLKRAGNRSTSTIDNLNEEFIASAWAEVLDNEWAFTSGTGALLAKLAAGYVKPD